MSEFFRFPQTSHIAWLGQTAPRDDKVLAPLQAVQLLHDAVVVEEKLDGANLGFSLDQHGNLVAQNRGQYLCEPFAGQFARLPDWLSLHGENLWCALSTHADDDLMLFGEWCAARHTLSYDGLPDWFLLFDVYDRRATKFWSSQRRNLLASEIGLATTPKVFQGRCDLPLLVSMLQLEPSRFRSGPLEGLVIRRESRDWCIDRAKLVRAEFTQAIDEHWSRRRLEWNRIQWLEQ